MDEMREVDERKDQDFKKRGRAKNNKNGNRKPNGQKCRKPGPKGNNDPNWYFTDPKLMESVSKFAFNNFLGFGNGVGANDIPYAMQIYMNPSAGCSMDMRTNNHNRTSGVNMAALKLYTTLSAQSGKTSNYGPEDLAILMLALGDLISFVEYGRRTLGLAFTYNSRNWNYPVNIIEACGFDESVLIDLPQKRMDFNVALNTINKIAFPANIAYFFKCTNLYQNVFLDSTSPMSQSYIYVPWSVWILDETSNPSGSVLKYTPLFSSVGATMSWDAYLQRLNSMIDAIMMSSTFNYIYGDVLNYAAKTSTPLLHLDLVSEDYAVIPVYNELALNQIHNMNSFGGPVSKVYYNDSAYTIATNTPGNDVIGDASTGTVRYNPVFNYKNMYIQDLYVDSLTPEPDVNIRVDMTRFAIRASEHRVCFDKGSGETTLDLITDAALPDHYVVKFNIISAGSNRASFDTSNEAEGGKWYSFASKLSQFDWAPIVYVCSSVNYKEDFLMFGDLDYYTALNRDYLAPVNELCYQGLFELR